MTDDNTFDGTYDRDVHGYDQPMVGPLDAPDRPSGTITSTRPPTPSIVTSRPSSASTSVTPERSRVKRPPPNS